MPHFAYYPNIASGVILNDEHDNSMCLYANTKSVSAYFRNGHMGDNPLEVLPRHYKTYLIRMQAISMADIEVIEQWADAEYVHVFYTAKPSDQVQECISKLTKTDNTTYIFLNL